MTTWTLERRQRIERPLEEVFAFFQDAGNLEELTPPELNFQVLTPLPIEMKAGALIDYRLKLYGVPFDWRTEIELFEPNVRFIDRQLRGPYKLWRHLHEFKEVDGGTVMTDRVDYQIPLGPLGALARVMFVRRQLERIFDFRRDRMLEIFPARSGDRDAAPDNDSPPELDSHATRASSSAAVVG